MNSTSSWFKRLLEEKIGQGREPSLSRVLVLIVGTATMGVGISALVFALTTDVLTAEYALNWWFKVYAASVGAYIGGQVGKGMSDARR